MTVTEKPYFYPVLILLAGLGVYANSLNNGFTFDDWPLVVHNSLVSQLDLGAIFSSSYWVNHPEYGLYRPLTTLSYSVNRLVLGEGAFGFHVINLVFHLGNGILVFYFLQFVIGRHGAGFGALLFLLHPIQTEAVNSIVGRAELLAAFWMLCGLIFYIKGRWVWATVALFLGCLCKEHALMLVGLFLCWDFWKSLQQKDDKSEENVDGANPACHPFSKGDYREIGFSLQGLRLFPYLIFVSAIVLFLIMRYAVIGAVLLPSMPQFIDNPLAHVSAWQRVLTAVAIVGKYIGLLFWPFALSADYSFDAIPIVGTLLNKSGAVVLALVALVLSLSRRVPSTYGLAVGFFAIPFLPVSNILFAIGTAMAERLMYVPMMGMVMFFGMGFQAWVQKMRGVGVGVAVLLLFACGSRTVMRNADWQSNATLFSSAVEAVPKSAKAHFNLGHEMHDQGKWQKALGQYAEAMEIYPQYAEVHYNVGVVYQEQREGERAIQAYRRTIALDSLHVNAWTNLGVILAEGEKLGEAIEAFAKVVTLVPTRIDAHYNLALTYQRSGLLDQAIVSYRTVLEKDPTYDDVAVNLGSLLERKRRPEEAIEAFLLAAKQSGKQSNLALFAVGRLYVQLGQKEDAKNALESFLKRWRGEAAVREHAERLLTQLSID